MHNSPTNLVPIAAVLVATMYYVYCQKDGTNATAAKDEKKKTESNHEDVAFIHDDPNCSGMVIKEKNCHEENAGEYCCSIKLFLFVFLLLCAMMPLGLMRSDISTNSSTKH